MSIEKLPVFETFPDKDKKLSRLIRWLEESIYDPIARRVSWLQDRIKDDTVEIVAADAKPGTDSNWRLHISGTDLLIQRKESGTWTTKSTISA
jgi:hypothetical protein